jgi:hypothetical protein
MRLLRDLWAGPASRLGLSLAAPGSRSTVLGAQPIMEDWRMALIVVRPDPDTRSASFRCTARTAALKAIRARLTRYRVE